ncbi:MAG: hypothetical protein ROO73_03540 [Roseivirga sp.]
MPYQTQPQRNTRLFCRLHHLEKKVIELSARKAGLSVSDYIRGAAIATTTQPACSQHERELYHLLVEYRNSFKHLITLAEEKQEFNLVSLELQGLIGLMRPLIDKLSP